MRKLLFLLILVQLINLSGLFSQNDTTFVKKLTQDELDYYLLTAADSGNHERVINLLKKGANVDADTYEGVTALIYAIQNGHYETARALVANGASLEKSPSNNETALMTAVKNNKEEITHYLLIKGASTKASNYYGNYPLHYAVAYDYYVIADMLIFYKADINIKNTDGFTPLTLAAYDGNLRLVELLIQKGADINITDKHNNTALMYASQEGHLEVADFLLKNKAEINTVNNKGASALCLAVSNGHKEIAFLLINNKASLSPASITDHNPYKIAIVSNQPEIADSLVKKGVKGKYKPFFNKLYLSYGFNFNPDDLMFETKFGINESKYKLAFDIGIANHYWSKRVLIEQSDNIFYQYWEKRGFLFMDAEKRFNLSTNLQKQNGFFIGVRGLYTYGKYRGINTKIDDKFMLSPQIGLYTMSKWVAAKINYEYMDFKVIGISPHRINLSFLLFFNLNKYQNINRNINFY